MKRGREDREFHIITLRPGKLLVKEEKSKKHLINLVEESIAVSA